MNLQKMGGILGVQHFTQGSLDQNRSVQHQGTSYIFATSNFICRFVLGKKLFEENEVLFKILEFCRAF